MYLDGDPVLHNMDEGNKFIAAPILLIISTDTIFETLVKC